MNARTFVDTSVLVYLFDDSSPAKKSRVRELLDALGDAAVVSTQVLQEFYSSVTRKLGRPLPELDALAALEGLARLDVVTVDTSIVLRSAKLSRTARLSFWDALIVEASLARGCSRLLSEDLQHGRAFGNLRIENPFREASR